MHFKANLRNFKVSCQAKFDNAKAKILQSCLWVWNFIIKFWFSSKRFFYRAIGLMVLSIGAFFLYRQHTNLEQCLIALNTSPGTNSGIYSNVFIAIGAAIIGVIAIAFSLSLFAIQHAADKHTPTILQAFLKDKTNRNIFCCIATIALTFYTFAAFPLNGAIFYEVIGGFLMIVFMFILLWKQYHHVTKLVNPNYQIILQHNEAIKRLERIDKWLDLMIRVGAITPGPDQEDSDI